LSVGCFTELKRALIHLVFGHKKVLNACGAADHEHEQASCDGVESSAVSDFSLVEAAANKVDDVVGSATWGFIY
jgi:hypothetical protein